MKGSGITRAALSPLFHDHFARIALVRLEPLVTHRGPTIAAIEKIADTHIERIARRSYLRGRSSSRRRRRRSRTLRACAGHWSRGHHASLPNTFTIGHLAAHFNDE